MQNAYLASLISAETLNARLPKSAGKYAGSPVFDLLCKTRDGLALLNHNPNLNQKLSSVINVNTPSVAFGSLFPHHGPDLSETCKRPSKLPKTNP